MIKLLIVSALLSSGVSAKTVTTQEIIKKKESTPKVFKDSKIKRKLKDGSTQEFDGDKFKIVPRIGYKRVVKTKTVIEKVVEKTKINKNRFKVLAGSAPKGLETTQTPSGAVVEEDRGLVLGLGYDRLVTEKVSLGAQVQTNRTIMLSIGLDF